MRKSIVLAFAGLSSSLAAAPQAIAAQQPNCEERSPMQRRLEYASVEVDQQRRLLFRLCAPRAQTVVLTSSEIDQVPKGFNGAAPGLAMAKDAQGYWAARIDTPVMPGPFRYAFNVDGIDVADPQGTQFSEDFRGVRSVFEVPGAEAAFQSWQADVPHGLVSVIEYRSEALGIMRRAHVYTPPGYEGAAGKRYPVLYLVHGAGDSDDSWTSDGHAQYILDNLIAAGRAKPMIIVMPFGHTPDRAGVDRMVNTDFDVDLSTQLIPYLDTHFRTLTGPTNRAMAGLSMGGAHTLQFGLTKPDVFGSIGIFSIGIAAEQVPEYRKANDLALKLRAKSNGLVFYAFGKDDFIYKISKPTREMMDAYKIKYTYRESNGGHDWKNWRDYLSIMAPMLFQ